MNSNSQTNPRWVYCNEKLWVSWSSVWVHLAEDRRGNRTQLLLLLCCRCCCCCCSGTNPVLLLFVCNLWFLLLFLTEETLRLSSFVQWRDSAAAEQWLPSRLWSSGVKRSVMDTEMWPSLTWPRRSGMEWLFVHSYTSTDRTSCKYSNVSCCHGVYSIMVSDCVLMCSLYSCLHRDYESLKKDDVFENNRLVSWFYVVFLFFILQYVWIVIHFLICTEGNILYFTGFYSKVWIVWQLYADDFQLFPKTICSEIFFFNLVKSVFAYLDI